MAACLRYMAAMVYMKSDLVERSGLPDRTIRNYMERGLIPRPEGHGPAAEYTDEHMLRAVAIGRMRAQGMQVDAIAEHIAGWSLAKFRRFVAQTEPAAPAAPPEPPPAPPADHESHPDGAAATTPRDARATSAAEPPDATERSAAHAPVERRERHEPILDADLPEGRCFRVLPLLPGLGLMLDVDAPLIVRRIAAEICERYGNAR
jgi:DNA-binding transcriptional MerR regulator